MAIPHEIGMIKKSMTMNKSGKFIISNYCRVVGVNRNKHYAFFGIGASNFFAYVLEKQIRITFSKEKKISDILFEALVEVKQYREVYLQMFKQTSFEEHNKMQEKLRKVLQEELREYSYHRKGISANRLESICGNIYSKFLDWIIHGCKEKMIDVYQAMKLHIPALEGHRCDKWEDD